jgi:hypothetical protein
MYTPSPTYCRAYRHLEAQLAREWVFLARRWNLTFKVRPSLESVAFSFEFEPTGERWMFINPRAMPELRREAIARNFELMDRCYGTPEREAETKRRSAAFDAWSARMNAEGRTEGRFYYRPATGKRANGHLKAEDK